MHLFLIGRPGICVEGARDVSRDTIWESTWEVAAVVRIIAACHGEFVARIDLRHAAHREQNSKCQFELGHCRSWLSHKALRVVVAEERNKTLGMRVERVETQDAG